MAVSVSHRRRTDLARVILAVLFVLNGCASHQRSEFHPSILVLQGAEDIAPFDGYTSAVQYFVTTSDPDRLVGTISNHLEKLQFSKVEFDSTNPSTPSSHTRGWVDFIDKDGTRVRMWQADWSSQDGSTVTYDLRYQVLSDGRPPRVQVSAMFRKTG